MSISAAVRLRVFAKSDYLCAGCKRARPLTIDHIIPRALGGSNMEENLQALCKPCNSKKGDSAVIPRKREARRRWFSALDALNEAERKRGDV